MIESDDTTEMSRTPPVPWRRVFRLLRPIRGGVAAMTGLSIAGVLVGLVPPLALGALVNVLVEYNDKPEALLFSGLVMLAVILEATAYVVSDGFYAQNASRMYRDLRLQMFAGAQRRARAGRDTSGLSSRFISDAETLESITLALLDTGAMTLVEFASALIALGLLEPWSLAAVAPLLAGTWIVTRRTQEPAAEAGHRRQEELEVMTRAIAKELEHPDSADASSRFRTAVERVMGAEVRYGWLRALNLQGSGGLARIGPIAVVVVAAFAGSHHAGTLVALYLLAQRTFWGFDGAVDLSLGSQSVRGAVHRCFDLIDTPHESAAEPLTTATPSAGAARDRSAV